MPGMKLTVIGAGSVYTPEIFHELILREPRLHFEEIVLVDIPQGWHEAELVMGLAQRMFQKHGYKTHLYLTLDRKAALENTDFVISQIRVGRLQAREKDERLGMELGLIGQETTGVGGFVNALRTIPVALDIARDMEQICPQAWLVNFTNPSGIVTEALKKYGGIRCVGLCNVPINMINDVAGVLGLEKSEVWCQFVGLNHLSFITAVRVHGNDRLSEVIQLLGENATLMKNIPKASGVGELAGVLGALPSPYLQYYYFEDQMRKKQEEEWKKNRVCRAVQVRQINENIFSLYKNENVFDVPQEVSRRGGSLYSFAALDIIEALAGVAPKELVVNTSNCGAVKDLAEDDVIETNCRVDQNGVEPLTYGTLPEKMAGLVKTVKQYERLTVRAAVERSRELAVCALLNHPLVHGFENATMVVERAREWFPDEINLD